MFGNLFNVGIQANAEIRSLLKDLVNEFASGHGCEDNFSSCLFIYSCITSFRILANCHTSSKVLYNGTGAILITFGSRQSAITPAFDKESKIIFPLSSISMETWQPGSFSFRDVINSIILLESESFIPSSKNHK